MIWPFCGLFYFFENIFFENKQFSTQISHFGSLCMFVNWTEIFNQSYKSALYALCKIEQFDRYFLMYSINRVKSYRLLNKRKFYILQSMGFDRKI